MTEGYIGRSLRRLEDRRFLIGQGCYVDDMDVPGQLHGVVLRSSHGHALIEGIDTAAARTVAGVHGVFTAADLDAEGSCRALPGWRPLRRSSCRRAGHWRATGFAMSAIRWR